MRLDPFHPDRDRRTVKVIAEFDREPDGPAGHGHALRSDPR